MVGPAPRPVQPELVRQPTHNASAARSLVPRVFKFPAWTRPAPSTPTTAGSETEAPPAFVSSSAADGVFPSSVLIGRPFVNVPAPPPPTPTAQRPKAPTEPLRVTSTVQMAKLIRKVMPVYPPLAKVARISGVVHLIGTIAKDGTIRNLQLIDGHPMLARAAVAAVEQWVYQPTLLNGVPVEVIAPIEVSFTLSQ